MSAPTADATTAAAATAAAGAAVLDLPADWPVSLHPTVLDGLALPTPFVACDLRLVADRVRRFTGALPGVRPFYAVKCNPAPEVLRTVAALGGGFEVASSGELDLLQDLGVDPADVLFSNTVKPAAAVAAAAAAGLWRFAADSEGEVRKIARHAPGSAVYVRVHVDDSASAFPLSRKFGVEPHAARELLRLAERLGLQPYGLTFHVGSQCTDPTAWARALRTTGAVVRDLARDGIELGMVDLGGGFPSAYGEPVPSIEAIGARTAAALEAELPYRPALLAAEPGRYLVAEAAVLATTVLGRAERAGQQWLYCDAGAFNGLREVVELGSPWHYPLWSSRADHASADRTPFTVTGPTCDSADTVFTGLPLPAGMAEGDRLYVAASGAYTLAYASQFNGFAVPGTHVLVG